MNEIREFIISIPPFDLLTDEELSLAVDNLNIEYFPQETKIKPDKVYIIIKGKIKTDEEILTNEDIVFAKEIIQNRDTSAEVIEETLAYELDKETFLKLLKNEKFKKFFLQDIASKLQHLKEKNYQNFFSSFLAARVKELIIHPVVFVKENETIKNSLLKKENEKASAIIVGDNAIVTDSNLKKIILNDISPKDAIIKIASSPLKTINYEDFLFNALLEMTKHNIKRLVVTKENEILGTIEQIDLLSYFSNHSHLINVKIEKAKSIEDLKEISDSFIELIKLLYSKGLNARYIAKVISALNEKIFQKIANFIFPQEYTKKSSLIVMGSEGRGEQIIRTDQDNGIILDNDLNINRKYFEEFTEALLKIGFPKCPGNVMLNNPFWSKSIDEYKNSIKEWIETPTKENMMNLAIILDAKHVWGEEKYLKELKSFLFENLTNHPTLLAYFASFIEMFELPVGIFGLKDEIDLKKIRFITVHAARSFALEKKIYATSTVERIKKISDLGIIDKKFATEIIESFDIILTFTLQNRLKQIENKEPLTNIIKTKNLTKIEKDMLKDAIKVTNEFKKLTKHHFHTEMVS